MSPSHPRFTPNAPRRVEILAFADAQLLDVAGPLQVFATACDLAGRGAGAAAGPPYAAVVVASGSGPVRCSAGLGLAAEPLPAPTRRSTRSWWRAVAA